MDLLMYVFIVLCVSLSLISADEVIKEKEASTTSPSSTPLTFSTVTTVMTNTSSMTDVATTATLTPHTLDTTDSATSRSFNSSSPSSLPGKSKLVSPTSAAFISHITSASSTTKSWQTTLSPTGTSQSGSMSFISSHDVQSETSTPQQASNCSLRISPEDPTFVPPTQPPSSSLTMLAFGVMSFILVLIVVMIILVTAVNLRGRCHNTKEEGVKSYDSGISESNMTNTGEKESITLVSVRSINTDTDTDSPQISSVHSTILDSEDQELNRDLLSVRAY